MEGRKMLDAIIDETSINADLHEEDFHHALDARQGDISREELQEKNSYFLKKLKEKFFPVKSEEQDQVLMNFLKILPACSTVRRERGRKRQVRKVLRYEELQLI